MVELQNNSPMGRTRWMLTSLPNREKSFQNLAGSVVDLQRYPLAIQLNVLVVSVFNSWVIDSPLSYVTSFFLTNQSKASITLIANQYHFCKIANFICTSNLKVSPSMYLTIKMLNDQYYRNGNFKLNNDTIWCDIGPISWYSRSNSAAVILHVIATLAEG